MAPVRSITWGLGVPGEIEATPGPAHSYRLIAGSRRAIAAMSGSWADSMTPGAKAQSFVADVDARAKARTLQFAASPVGAGPSAPSYPKFPKRKTKRGLYVYEN
jgi:hypothetical protein